MSYEIGDIPEGSKYYPLNCVQRISVELCCFSFYALTPRSDKRKIAPLNIHTLSSKQVNRNIQTYQVEAVILMKHQILVTDLLGIV